MSIARTEAVDAAADDDSPRSSSGPRSSAPIDGLAMKPRTSVVSVMPSWHAESWVDSLRWEASTDLRARLPRVDRALHGRSVEGDERELGRDEQRGAHGEHDAEAAAAAIRSWGGRFGGACGPAYGRASPGPRSRGGHPDRDAGVRGSTPRGSRIHRGVDPHAG